MSDQMAADHRRDYEAKARIDEARRAIDLLLATDHRLSPRDKAILIDARGALSSASRHIEAVWD